MAEADVARILLGQLLLDIGRAVDLATFAFGPSGLAARPSRGPLGIASLHVQCPWRIVRTGSILVGYSDHAFPPAGVSRDQFDQPEARRTRRDDLTDEVVRHGSGGHEVRDVAVSPALDLVITFADGCRLEVLPDFASMDEDGHDEYWRLIVDGPPERHLVATAHGFDE